MKERSSTGTLPKELNPESYLSKKQVRTFLGGIGNTTLQDWVRRRNFPRPVRISKTFPIWKVRDVIDWVNQQNERS